MSFLMVCLVGLLVSVDASPVSSPMIEGQVRLSNGSPVVGAQVVLFDVADLRRGPVGQATTDEAGQFVLPLAAGGGWVLPSEVGLGQNYPNPFNPSTLIPYQLAASSPVRLEVFNILGQRVATLVDEEQSAGSYRARWDGTDAAGRAAASGVYFYRLTVDGAHWTGKMVLVDGQAGVPLGGARVAAVPLAEGSSATYGLVVSGDGLVTYVDSDFVVAAGQGPVAIEVSAEPNVRGKVVASLEGILGDVDNNDRVDMDDGLLVAMLSVDPALALPHHGLMTLGDVNCDGRVELDDAALLAAYVDNPADAAVSSLRIGQPGGYSLDPVTEIVWGSILGTEKKDATVVRILAGVPVLLSGVRPVDGEDRLYLGIDRAYWTQQGGKQLYEALKQRFPATPIHVKPSAGMRLLAGKVRARPTTTALRKVAPVTRFGPPMSFADSPNAALPDNSKAPKVVGSITVPDDVTVGSVAVAVDITHPSRGDLKIELVAPSGVVVPLYNGIRRGVDLADNITGTIATTDALQGQAAKGTWHLRVGDYEQGDAGTLNAWELTVTPAQETPATEEPVNLFLETFQEGLGAWRTTTWEAASFDTDSGVPGEGPGNIVAKAEGCSVCFLTLDTPVDLSAHDSVTLSFYRWLDPGMSNSEFLGVDIGNNGSYQRLQNWSGQHADGKWHLETFTLTGDQISDSFTLRFFGIAQNNFTTVAIDNVMIAATPGTVTITPETAPDLKVTETTITQEDPLTLQTTIQNISAPTSTRTVQVYRHTQRTQTPKQGGTIVSVVGTVVPTNGTKTVQITTTKPQEPGTYYYYSCVNALENEEDTTNNCTQTPAVLVVQEEETTPTGSGPDLIIKHDIKSSKTVQAGATITFYPRVTNQGEEVAPVTAIHIYRHNAETNNPRQGGVQHSTTAKTSSLAPGRSVLTFARTTASQTPGIHYYYLCTEAVTNETDTSNNCSGSVTVTTEGIPEQEQVVEAPDLATTNATATQSNNTITVRATVTNVGTQQAPATTVRVYRHTSTTSSPATGGVREPNTATTPTVASKVSIIVTSTHTVPSVTRSTTYHYYVCLEVVEGEQVTNNNCSPAATVTVAPVQEKPILVPSRGNIPMGGDYELVNQKDIGFGSAGTITLGGLETTSGVPGFVVSAHVVAPDKPNRYEDFAAGYNTFVGQRSAAYTFRHLLGKVFRMPTIERKMLEGAQRDLLIADAAFVAYPQLMKSGCQETYKEYDEFEDREYCLDADPDDTFLERVAPLKIRGEGDTTYTVTGSKEPTDGKTIWLTGGKTGVDKGRQIVNGGGKLLTFGRGYVRFTYHANGDLLIGGDSGSPVYTKPDASGNTNILGILVGGYYNSEEDKGVFFSAWSDVEKALDLKPISAPDSPSPAEEDEEELAGLFSAFD